VDEQPGAAHPEERLEAVHAEEVIGAEDAWRNKHAQGTGELRIASAAEFASDQAGEENLRGACEDGEAANRQQGVAEDGAFKPGQQGHQRRLIDVAPGKVAGAIEVVKLIDEEAITAARLEVHRDLD